jgi:hypothetical protein
MTIGLLGWAKRLFRQLLLRLFPTSFIYVLTVIAFWPTTCLNLALAHCCRRRYRRWDRIADGVILGAAPLWKSDILLLQRDENVTGIINLCAEWDAHRDTYSQVGLSQLNLPTIDFFPPSFEDCLRGAEFIRVRVERRVLDERCHFFLAVS